MSLEANDIEHMKHLNFHIFLTWIQDSKPGNLTLGLNFCIESDVQVKNSQILNPEESR